MGSPILGSSNLHIIGENRCSRKWGNKTEGPKILPVNQSKCLRFHLTENWAPNWFTKLIQKNSLPSTAHESQFSDKQKFHRAPKQRRPFSTEVRSNWPFILWLLRIASSARWYTFLSRERITSWYEIMHHHIRKPTHNRRLSPTRYNRCYKTVCWTSYVIRQYAGHQMLQDSMLDVKCFKTVCWILERLF